MSLFDRPKSLSLVLVTFSSVVVSNLIFANSANAFSVTFSNGGFESDIINSQNSWNTIGDVTTSTGIDGVTPTADLYQAIITTGYRATVDSDGEARSDDNGLIFNQSTNEPVDASIDPNKANLQKHFGFGTNAFSIDRSTGATFPDPRTSKEGSGMYQDFSVTLGAGETSFTVAFDWAFLTNDGTTSDGGEQDFAFWSLGQYDSGTDTYNTAFSSTGNPDNQITVLRSSSGTISSPSTTNDYVYDYDYDAVGNERYTYTVSGLDPEQTYNYRLGYGVVDVDGYDRTSALLIDNVEVIPFEFSPALGLISVASLFGLSRLRRKLQQQAKSNSDAV